MSHWMAVIMPFGSYGAQKGDNQADISNEKQQEEIAAELIKWLQTSEK